MIWASVLVMVFFDLLYFLIVFDVIRNSWFYIFTDVSENFVAAVNMVASLFAAVEVSEPGLEAMTYALVSTAGNVANPVSKVITIQVS